MRNNDHNSESVDDVYANLSAERIEDDEGSVPYSTNAFNDCIEILAAADFNPETISPPIIVSLLQSS